MSNAKYGILIVLALLLPLYLLGANGEGNVGHYEYQVLRKNKPLSKQLQKKHAIYEIKYNYDLHGETVLIPSDCILKFEGGHIINGKLVFDNTIIESSYKEVFDDIEVEGSIANNDVWLSWWKLKYSRAFNDAILINQIINAIDNCILYYDILHDIYIGAEKPGGTTGEIIHFTGKKNLRVIQTTKYFTVLRGRSKGGNVIRCSDNKYISIDGLKVDGANIYYCEQGENGIGVTGNEKALIENCVIRNCFSDCFGKDTNGKLLKSGYPEWGAGGKGIQIEGGSVATQVTVRNNSISNCYIGISNNAAHQESVVMNGNNIDSCYMSIILLRLSEKIDMNVNIDNTIIANNTGDVGVICMGNPQNVCISNTQIKGSNKTKAILRGCFSYSNIQLIVNQPCESLMDAALYRDNPEGHLALHNFVRIISDQTCDNIITTSEIIPKRGGSTYTEYVGNEIDITLPEKVNKTPIMLPSVNKTSVFNIRYGTRIQTGDMELINKKK